MGRHEKLLKLSEIGLWLNTYDDIFSSFDPRPYHQRALSVDFLDEAKRASREKISGIDLKLLIDRKRRNEKDEKLIKRKLRSHFNKHYKLLLKEKGGIVRRGTLFISAGLIVMAIASIILFGHEINLFTNFLIVLMEPAGWFLFWEGLNQVIFESKRVNPDLEFYKKMTRCRIEFVSY